MPEIPLSWKETAARLMRVPLMHRLMVWAIQLTVPRQRVGVAMVAMDDRAGPMRLSPEIIEARWIAVGDMPAPLLPFIHRAINEAFKIYRALKSGNIEGHDIFSTRSR